MKVAVVGAGAMGSLFGGLLSAAGGDVCLLDVWPEHVQRLRERGLVIVRDGVERLIPIQAFTDLDRIGPVDLALIFVKHGQTAEAATTARRLCGENGVALTLQNGMGNAEIISRIMGPERVLCGTTAQGAMLLGPGRIQHSGEGKTVIGPWSGAERSLAAEVAQFFSVSGIPTGTKEDIRPVLWAKLLANVGINAVTALTGIRNGQLLDLEPTRELVAAAVNEGVMVARALDIELAPDALETVFAIAEATGTNRSSMGQDVDARRRTEIGAINGYIVDRAREAGLEVPVNRTLTSLIQTLQAHY